MRPLSALPSGSSDWPYGSSGAAGADCRVAAPASLAVIALSVLQLPEAARSQDGRLMTSDVQAL